jgi:hypothetical protein
MVELTFADDLLGRRLIFQRGYLYVCLHLSPALPTNQAQTAEEDQTELNTYDAKIYAASNQMAQALTLELRGLGIPFFSIKRDLVTGDHKNNDDHDKQHKDKLPREELSALQLRMLELLQDLCKE